jgi:hypothetical protein
LNPPALVSDQVIVKACAADLTLRRRAIMISADWILKGAALVYPSEPEATAGVMILVGVVFIPVYLILQVWFGYAWAGRWRIAAFIPLAGLAAFMYLNFRPPAEIADPLNALVLVAPLSSIYLAIVGITRAIFDGAGTRTGTTFAK